MTLPIMVGVAVAAGVLFNWLADTLPVDRRRANQSEENLYRSQSQRLPSIYTLLAGERVPHPLAAAPWRYPLVELACIGAALSLMLALDEPTAFKVVKTLYVLFFILIIVIDVEHKLILTAIMLPAFFVALIEVIITSRITITEGLAGYALGQIVFMAMYLFGQAYVWFVNRRREKKITTVAFGAGDVTLATFCGLIIGPAGVFSMVFLTVFLGGFFAILYVVLGSIIQGRGNISSAIPYGPAIAIAATIILLAGPDGVLSLFS